VTDELRPDESWQWGVQHKQGIRPETSEQSARESLQWLTTAFEANSRNTVRPTIVRRRVSQWQTFDMTAV
jgi:hypothetical protein